MGKAKRRTETKSDEAIIPLPNGGTLRCGPDDLYTYGGYVRICDKAGHEILYWDKAEWAETPALVMGAIFGASIKTLKELTRDRKLTSAGWVFDFEKRQSGKR